VAQPILAAPSISGAVSLDEHAVSVTLARERALHGDGVAIHGALDAILHPIH
jgi:hypothetical protein